MRQKTSFILKATNVIFWIIFIGLCIKTGAILISFLISLFVNVDGTKNLYLGLNLSNLYAFSVWHYVIVVSCIVLLTGLKAYIAYLAVRIFLKLDIINPFTADVATLISRISYIALGTGVLAVIASGYSEWLIKKGIAIPENWASGEFLFLAGRIFIIAQVFEKGIEIQTDNELTI